MSLRRPVDLLRPFLIGAAAAYAVLFAWTGRLAGQAEASYWAGRLDEAHESLARASFWHVRGGRVSDALGLVDLARGRAAEAAVHLDRARRGFFHPAAFGEERVLLDWLRRGRFQAAAAYAEHRLQVSRSPSTLYYLGTAERALGRLEEAERHLAEAASSRAMSRRAEEQRALLAAARSRGRVDYLFDRRGRAVGSIDARSGRPSPLATELAPLLRGAGLPPGDPGAAAGRIDLTLDLEIQRAAQAALGTRRGCLVAIEPLTGALLAAASQPPSPGALDEAVEPGSIIKMITLSAALRAGVNLAGLFPLECPGWIPIDGVAFRDWTTHRRVASIDEAVAVSCNVAFGRLGALVGRDALNAELRRFGFDTPDPDRRQGGEFTFTAGGMTAPDASHPAFALARRAEGLDSLTITPIQAALLAAGLARGGAPAAPYLIREKRNILGEVTFRHESAVPARDADSLRPESAALVVKAMKYAVTSPSGTARRAAVEGISAAMKTGTSGEDPPGYDALVIGFAPAESPSIAWALVARRAGRAELEGARITKAFLERIKDKLQ